jgi:hypothetical protein
VFQLEPNPTFKVTVQITVPGGGTRPLPVTFRHKKRSELQKWTADTNQSDLDMALEIVESVEGKAEQQTLKEFFTELLENYPAAGLDLYTTYRRELTESRAKN